MVLLKLAISNLLVRKVRTGMTAAAIALSVSLVVAVTSGFKAMEAKTLGFLQQYMGTADAMIQVENQSVRPAPPTLMEDLRKDVAVASLSARLETERTLNVDATRGLTADVVGIDPSDPIIGATPTTAGQWFDSTDGLVAVIDQAGAELLHLQIGDPLLIPNLQPMTVKIAGIVHRPTFFASRRPTLYMPIHTVQELVDPGHVRGVGATTISLNFKSGADAPAFAARWKLKLEELDPNLHLRMSRDTAGDLQKNLRSVQMLTYLGGAVSMLTAMFITFSALSMGVTERQRTLAMLRAIGSTRGQVAALVVLEGFSLALAGIALGVPLGIGWAYILAWKFSKIFGLAIGMKISLGGIAFAGVGSMVTALVASLLPAWSATRVDPLEAMNAWSGSVAGSGRARVGWAAVGLLLIGITPALFYGPVETICRWLGAVDPHDLATPVRFYGYLTVGLPALMGGFLLLAPLTVWSIERALSPLVAHLFGLPPQMLRQQLTGGIWRAAGAAAALMVGLATLVALQVQGNTLIGSWRLPDKFPDIFIASHDVITWADQKRLEDIPGIKKGHLMPVVVTSVYGDSPLSTALASQMSADKNTAMVFFGVDPNQALDMVLLDFRDDQGRPMSHDDQYIAAAKSVELLNKGGYVIVTDDMRQAKGKHVGDTISMKTPHGQKQYTICGVVWSPGIDTIISMYDAARMLDQRTSGCVFGSIADAKSDFDATGAWLFAADLQGGVPKEELLSQIKQKLGPMGLEAGDVRQIKYAVEQTFRKLLLLAGTVAFAAMAVASLGVANTLMASVRSRRWQFGVLRSVGVTRGELTALVVGEAILLGLVGIALGLACGAEMSFAAGRIAVGILGYNPPLQFPWHIILMGMGIVMAVAILGSLWPAISVAATEPLELLQAGRGSM